MSRLDRRIGLLTTGWFFALFAPLLLDVFPLTGGAWALARVTAVVGYTILMLAFTLHSFRRFDELVRRVILEAFAFGMATSILAVLGLGELERAGFLPALGLDDAYMLMIALTIVGMLFSWRRYR